MQRKSAKLFDELLEKNADDPVVLYTALNVLKILGKGPLRISQRSKESLEAADKAARSYGPAMNKELKIRIATVLSEIDGAARYALEFVNGLEKDLSGKDDTNTLVRILNPLMIALKKAGKTDEANAVAGRIKKLDEILDSQYLAKVPPFKPEKYQGRSTKSRALRVRSPQKISTQSVPEPSVRAGRVHPCRVQFQEFFGVIIGLFQRFVKGKSFSKPAMLDGRFLSVPVNGDPPHRLGRRRKEVAAIGELLIADHTNRGFVNEGGWLKCVPRLLLIHAPPQASAARHRQAAIAERRPDGRQHGRLQGGESHRTWRRLYGDYFTSRGIGARGDGYFARSARHFFASSDLSVAVIVHQRVEGLGTRAFACGGMVFSRAFIPS